MAGIKERLATLEQKVRELCKKCSNNEKKISELFKYAYMVAGGSFLIGIIWAIFQGYIALQHLRK